MERVAPNALFGSPRRFTLLAAVVLALTIALAWSGSLDGPFVLDDGQNIERNASLRDLGDWRRVLSPPPEISTGGRPVLNLSFALNHALGGLSPRGYRLTNLAIHAAAALALFGLVRRTLCSPALRERFGAASDSLALAAALLWAVHPLQTSSVTYVSQRAESLMGLFYLLTLYGVARAAAPGARGTRGWKSLAVLACTLGVGTKEIIVTVPVLALLYDRTFFAGSFRAAWRERNGLHLSLFAAVALIIFLLPGLGARGIGGAADMTPWHYATLECRVVLAYLKLALWPHPLVLDYGAIPDAPLRSLACGLVLLSLAGAALYAVVRKPALGFLGAWWFVILAPTSSFVPVTFQPMAENRPYLPLAAVTVALVLAVRIVFFRLGPALIVALAALFIALTIRRNHDYRDAVVLWTDTLTKRPENVRAANEHATALARDGRIRDAAAAFERALALHPDSTPLHQNFALLLMRERRLDEALPHFAAVVRLQPDLVAGRQDYARALAAANRVPEAIEQIEAAAKLIPSDAGPHLTLGQLQRQKGDLDAARAQFEFAVQRAPADPQARNELAQTLAALGRLREALPQFARAVELAPDNAACRYDFGFALIQSGEASAALTQFEAAARLQPNTPGIEFALANTLATLGRLPEALAHYETTLRLDPNFPQAREFLAAARARLSR